MPLRTSQRAPSGPPPERDSRRPKTESTRTRAFRFLSACSGIRQVHEHCDVEAARAVNVGLTVRNWMIGWYIRQYEQDGADRSTYGTRLLENLSDESRSVLYRAVSGPVSPTLRRVSPESEITNFRMPIPAARAPALKSEKRHCPAYSWLNLPIQLKSHRFPNSQWTQVHVLVELRVDEFRHQHTGQLNTYVTWYGKHMMAEGDNPPVGLLLCTQKDHALVEYALAAVDNRLFVSKYQVDLPGKEELQRFWRRNGENSAARDEFSRRVETEFEHHLGYRCPRRSEWAPASKRTISRALTDQVFTSRDPMILAISFLWPIKGFHSPRNSAEVKATGCPDLLSPPPPTRKSMLLAVVPRGPRTKGGWGVVRRGYSMFGVPTE